MHWTKHLMQFHKLNWGRKSTEATNPKNSSCKSPTPCAWAQALNHEMIEKRDDDESYSVPSKVQNVTVIFEKAIVGLQGSGVFLLASGRDDDLLEVADITGAVPQSHKVFHVSPSPKKMTMNGGILVLVVFDIIPTAAVRSEMNLGSGDIITKHPLATRVSNIVLGRENLQANSLVRMERLVWSVRLNLGL